MDAMTASSSEHEEPRELQNTPMGVPVAQLCAGACASCAVLPCLSVCGCQVEGGASCSRSAFNVLLDHLTRASLRKLIGLCHLTVDSPDA